jgi:hypothetical protein
MGVDHIFSFGYGFFIPPVKSLEEIEALDSLINKNGIRYCQDAYNHEQKIFICVGGFTQYAWYPTIEYSDKNNVSFEISDDDITILNELAEKLNVEKNYSWYGFHYAR